MEDIKIAHLKSNAQKLETWIAMLNGEIIGHIYMEREDNKKIKFLDAWDDAERLYHKINCGKLMGKVCVVKLPKDKDIADLQGNLTDYPEFKLD